MFRRPFHQIYFSVEKTFGTSLEFLPPDLEPVRAVCRYESRGLWRRLYNIIEASFRQGDINHITGDVQYLAFLLRKKKTILTVLDCGFETRLTGRQWILLWFWYILPVRRVAKVTAISQFTKDRLIHYTRCDPDKVHVVPVCITTAFRRIDRPFNASCPTNSTLGRWEIELNRSSMR